MRLIVCALFAVIVCGSVNAGSTPATPARLAALSDGCPAGRVTGPIDLRVLRQVQYDYQPYASPEALAATEQAAEVVVAGRVAGFLPGSAYGTPDRRLLMRVRVDGRFKGKSAQVVYVEFHQGGVLGASGEPIQGIADFEPGVP